MSVALTEVPGQAGAVPLLSQALLETWRRRENGRLTLDGYRAAGGLAGPVVAAAERVYAGLTPHAQVVARGVLLRLVTGGEHEARRRAPLSEVLAAGDPAETATVVDALAAARVVVVGESTVELAHEALAGAWPRLREWLTADPEGLRVHRDLTGAALVWRTHDRDPGTLYSGVRLTIASAPAERRWSPRRRNVSSSTPARHRRTATDGATPAVASRSSRSARCWSPSCSSSR